jgi:regulator of sigma E protease
VAVAARPTERWSDVAIAILTSGGRPVALEVERAGARLTATVVPEVPAGQEFAEAGLFPEVLPRIGQVNPGSPAETAGLRRGDVVRAVEGRPIYGSADFIAAIEQRADQPTAIVVLRGEERIELVAVPRPVDGKGRIGVSLVYERKYPPLRALVESVRFNAEMVEQTLLLLGKVARREVSARSTLSGPLGIADQSGEIAKRSPKEFVYWMAMISLSIGLLNLFPVPILDGGQIAILLVESTLRRDLSLAFKIRLAQVGLALIVLLMVAVLYFDASKLFAR